MDIKKISEKNNVLKIIVSGMDTPLLNSLRRIIMNAVPSYAAENIDIYENSSIMADEMLAHRIGLLPIQVNEKKIKKKDSIKLSLEKEGPGMVYSSDISPPSKDVKIMQDKIPLVKLKKDQKVKMEIEITVGTGKEHAKWQPALIAYKQVPKVTFSNIKDPNAFVKQFHPHELEVKASKVFMVDPANSRLIGLLQEKFPNEVEVDYDTKSFVVTIESLQGTSNKEILLQGLKVLGEKNQAFKEAIQKS
ncbi:DNA-directed RNA polymerase subunit D [Candidatus Micrarchaeota archaeon]|nr:DNA-directed RNA polymerase subunit D [Candidatus Micrarchaeota archaeon]MBU1930921.1 DNA-directed RNA polymerase subunit D [Candidatus Micrarchaeota archaeon]